VQRKLRATATWCRRINELAPYDRGGREWHYALVNESIFEDWRRKGARLGELLAFSRIRPVAGAESQGTLTL
jgi:type III restriction enzyme